MDIVFTGAILCGIIYIYAKYRESETESYLVLLFSPLGISPGNSIFSLFTKAEILKTNTFIVWILQLFGLGVANIFGSFFSAYPTTGESVVMQV